MSYIYLIKCWSPEPVYKIGYSKNPSDARMSQLQTGCPYLLELIYEFQTRFGQELERAIHRRFNSCHLRLEWFELSVEDVNHFEYLCIQIENNLRLIACN